MTAELKLVPNPDASDFERIVAAPSNPMAVARGLISELWTVDGLPTLRHWRGSWWEWRTSHWAEVEPRTIMAVLYEYTETAGYPDPKTPMLMLPWQPTDRKIRDLREALNAVCHLTERLEQPAWITTTAGSTARSHVDHLDQVDRPDRIVATRNGLLDIKTDVLLPHTPTYFNTTAVTFDYAPDAPTPGVWLGFLDVLWPSDPEQIALLQEWFGYVISGRTDEQKILLVIGPTRGGKGVMARTLMNLIGRDNCAAPVLGSLGGEFGLQPLYGKSLAVCTDARIGGKTDTSVVVERLLSLSGEDTITVNRKYRDQVTIRMSARFMICSNEMPQLGDASGAIAGRFVTLMLERTWFGNEDKTLETRISPELPGVLNWALDGLRRLDAQGRFTEPGSTVRAYVELRDLASPVSAFVRECCVIDQTASVPRDYLYTAAMRFLEGEGHRRMDAAKFGRNLRAVVPHVRDERPRQDGHPVRVYTGIKLLADPTDPRDPRAGGM